MTNDQPTPALAADAAELYKIVTGEELESNSRLADMFAVEPDGRWTLRVVHGATQQLLAARAFAGLFLLDEQLIWSFYRNVTLLDVFRRTADCLDGSEVLRRQVKRIRRANGAQQVEMVSGARLMFINRDGGHRGRGISADCHLLDEYYGDPRSGTDAIPLALINGAGRRNPQLVVGP